MFSLRRVAEHMLSNALDRSGQAPMIEQEALAEGAALVRADLPALATTSRKARTSSRGLLLDSLSQKILGAWVQNRHQTLYPLAMNFRNLDAAQTRLLAQTIAVAAEAGDRTEDRLPHVQAWMKGTGASPAQLAALDDAIAEPRALHTLIGDIQAAQLGPYAYAVSLVALDQASLVNRSYLDYLAARLAIPSDVARSLAKRYRL